MPVFQMQNLSFFFPLTRGRSSAIVENPVLREEVVEAKAVNSAGFIAAIRERLEKRLA